MIKINLLPPELAGKKKAQRISTGPAPSFLSFLILIPVYLITLGIVYKIYDAKITSAKTVDNAQKKLERLKKQKVEQEQKFKDLKETYSILNDQIEILRSLDPPDRLLWSEKLNMLSELIPKGIFITSMKLSEKVEQIETAESKRRQVEWNAQGKNKKGPAPEVIKKPVARQTFEMSGVAYTDKPGSEEKLDLIVKFYQSLKDFQTTNHKGQVRKFMDNFNPKVNFKDLQETKILDRSVYKFTFIMTTKPVTADIAK